MHTKKIVSSGEPLDSARYAMIMLHGRGASAEDILSLAGYLDARQFALLAPQATNHTWYPYSFLAPRQQNEPWLTSALDVVGEVVEDLTVKGFSSDRIFLLGFSQGACLTLEYAARNAARYGGIIAFTGGLIGDHLDASGYKGDFKGTPVFIGTSDPDPHVPVSRVRESIAILSGLHAVVTGKIYPEMGHTINEDEITQVKEKILPK